MFIGKGVYIELGTLLQHVIRRPGRVHAPSEARNKRNAALYALSREDYRGALVLYARVVNDRALNLVQVMPALRARTELREPFHVREVRRYVRSVAEYGLARIVWQAKYEAHLADTRFCMNISVDIPVR